MLTAKEAELGIRCLEIYMGNYSVEKQHASSLILKMLFKERYGELMALVKEATGFKVNNRQDAKVIAWKRKVKKAGKCNMCGAKEMLVAHHIVPWEYSIAGRTDIKNGMCLCRNCHRLVHSVEEYTDYMRGCSNE